MSMDSQERSRSALQRWLNALGSCLATTHMLGELDVAGVHGTQMLLVGRVVDAPLRHDLQLAQHLDGVLEGLGSLHALTLVQEPQVPSKVLHGRQDGLCEGRGSHRRSPLLVGDNRLQSPTVADNRWTVQGGSGSRS